MTVRAGADRSRSKASAARTYAFAQGVVTVKARRGLSHRPRARPAKEATQDEDGDGDHDYCWENGFDDGAGDADADANEQDDTSGAGELIHGLRPSSSAPRPMRSASVASASHSRRLALTHPCISRIASTKATGMIVNSPTSRTQLRMSRGFTDQGGGEASSSLARLPATSPGGPRRRFVRSCSQPARRSSEQGSSQSVALGGPVFACRHT